MDQPEIKEEKMEQGDDVLAGIMKGDESDDEEMPDNRNSIPTSPVSPVSPPNPGLKIEPLTPPQQEENDNDNNNHDDDNKEKEKDKENRNGNRDEAVEYGSRDDPSTPLAEKTRILKLSGDSGRKSRNRIDVDEDKDRRSTSGLSTIEDFANRPDGKPLRFFVIKSFSEKHLQISIDKGIWATQRHNEVKLNDAFKKSDVVLVFSVNESRHFQGYAQMTSRIGGHKPANNVWTDSKDDGVWGSSFSVKWLQLHNLPFSDTLHLRNPMNEDKPVKISRDGTELARDTAMALCALIDKGAAQGDKKRKPLGDSGDSFTESKRNRSAPPRANEFLPLPPPRRVVLPPNTHLPYPSMAPFNNRNYPPAPLGPSRYPHSNNHNNHNHNYHNNHNNHNNHPHNNNNNPYHPHHHMIPSHQHYPPHSGPHSHSGPYSRPPFPPSGPSRNMNDRYPPRHDSPPPKRRRSISPPLSSVTNYHPHDRKRKDREDERRDAIRGRGRDDRDLDNKDRDWGKDRERGREREREQEREREREREKEREREREREKERERERERDKERERDRGRDRDRRDSRDKLRSSSDSPPPDLLNMSYEDYLRALAKYRRVPSTVPNWGLGTNALSERDYAQYMAMLAKIGSSASLFAGKPTAP